ncbi:Uncharacterised protein [BD1-7 clade bacterium]|uniref:Uncharacterized protein n=1 Tax=BD1-7 clade bacterium TaxID=2029982 RepID=A0A5S9QW70_9GAMM|nr:Uncharacterised protein [BD1-7 clade bacterium]
MSENYNHTEALIYRVIDSETHERKESKSILVVSLLFLALAFYHDSQEIFIALACFVPIRAFWVNLSPRLDTLRELIRHLDSENRRA